MSISDHWYANSSCRNCMHPSKKETSKPGGKKTVVPKHLQYCIIAAAAGGGGVCRLSQPTAVHCIEISKGKWEKKVDSSSSPCTWLENCTVGRV